MIPGVTGKVKGDEAVKIASPGMVISGIYRLSRISPDSGEKMDDYLVKIVLIRALSKKIGP
jgi:hypothetical protein